MSQANNSRTTNASEPPAAPDLFGAELSLGALEGNLTTLSLLLEDDFFQECPQNEALGYLPNQLLRHSKELRENLFSAGRDAVQWQGTSEVAYN
jgi:hypothetical protein